MDTPECSSNRVYVFKVDEDGVISLDGGVWSLDGKEVRRKKISRKLNRDEAEENKNGSESEGGTLKKKASKRSSFSSVAVTDAVSWQGGMITAGYSLTINLYRDRRQDVVPEMEGK